MTTPAELIEKFSEDLNAYTREAASKSAQEAAAGINAAYERILAEGKAEIDRFYAMSAEDAKRVFEKELGALKDEYINRLGKRKGGRFKGFVNYLIGGAVSLGLLGGVMYAVWHKGEEQERMVYPHGRLLRVENIQKRTDKSPYAGGDVDVVFSAAYWRDKNGDRKADRAELTYYELQTNMAEAEADKIKATLSQGKVPLVCVDRDPLRYTPGKSHEFKTQFLGCEDSVQKWKVDKPALRVLDAKLQNFTDDYRDAIYSDR